ncbi:MAG: glycoside hydrolase family 88 protein [Opitutaceae bacterium]|nr:glycoside hydrolase family 88 protein [Opitutaceae bacterium]
MRTPILPIFAAITASTSLVAADPAIDYTRRIDGATAVPEYAIPYVVPTPDAVKATLDRIRDHAVRSTSLKVFDNATGFEITDPAKLTATAVLDGRYGGLNRWDYTNGVIIAAFDLIGDVTGDSSYQEYNTRFYDFIFTWMPAFREREERTGKRSEFTKMVHMQALDHCGAITAALVKTQRRHPDARYRAWIDVVDAYISRGQFRLPDGTLARERPQAASLWTDDFYMCIPFLAQMGVLTGESRYFDDAVRQVVQLSERLFVPERGLYDHGWSVVSHPYDPRHYWGRANGWAAMAMAELLTVLPKDHPGREAVLHQFRAHIRGIVEAQDGSGLWHNMLDRESTYLETSASAMFVFAIARGINEGWLPALYAPVAITGWNGVAARVLPDGRVEGVCEGTTYANDMVYYAHRGAGSHTTFFGSVAFAGGEVIRLIKNPAVSITPAVAGSANSAIHARPAAK